jgi:hypothetical protein
VRRYRLLLQIYMQPLFIGNLANGGSYLLVCSFYIMLFSAIPYLIDPALGDISDTLVGPVVFARNAQSANGQATDRCQWNFPVQGKIRWSNALFLALDIFGVLVFRFGWIKFQCGGQLGPRHGSVVGNFAQRPFGHLASLVKDDSRPRRCLKGGRPYLLRKWYCNRHIFDHHTDAAVS